MDYSAYGYAARGSRAFKRAGPSSPRLAAEVPCWTRICGMEYKGSSRAGGLRLRFVSYPPAPCQAGRSAFNPIPGLSDLLPLVVSTARGASFFRPFNPCAPIAQLDVFRQRLGDHPICRRIAHYSILRTAAAPVIGLPNVARSAAARPAACAAASTVDGAYPLHVRR